jgi:hypothetical protein
MQDEQRFDEKKCTQTLQEELHTQHLELRIKQNLLPYRGGGGGRLLDFVILKAFFINHTLLF